MCNWPHVRLCKYTPLMKKPSNLQVSHQVINSSLSYEAFMVSKDFHFFFTKQLSTFFETPIEQGFAVVDIDDNLLLSNSKERMFQLIEQLNIISTRNNLKLAPEKFFFMLIMVKFLGHGNGYNTIKPVHSKIAAIHKILLLKVSFIGALNFYTKFNKKLHINLKPFYDRLHENTPWKSTNEHETMF